ncbi:MAG TPA: penicillin-binding protein activator [Acetobacteraceae bacterium]|nr:penicillin-binding protein activator [Acetobacteraceae bacterium]
MRRRAFLLLGPLALAGCSAYYPAGGYGAGYGGGYANGPIGLGVGQPMPEAAPRNERVAILVPLTGPRAGLGQALLQAAQLALAVPGAPLLEVKDTGGTPQGAAAAAQAAIAEGAGIILGPLMSTEAAAVAPVARAAGVAVLAFTNDPAQAQPGVWTLGITPGQQVRRLVAAVQAQGRSQLAALLPDSEFGRVMAQALTQAAAANGLPQPEIRFHEAGMASINPVTRELADYADRRGPIDAQIRQARALGTPEGRRQALELAKTPIPPPSFSALLLADTGEALAEVAAMLPYYDVDRSRVQLLGPSLWASPSSGSNQVPGAWFAAPDPAARAGLAQSYAAKYGTPPPVVADLAFDAASIARVLGASGGFSISALTQPAGFIGADGWLALLPDGQVRRGLAVFRVERGGPEMIEPAPQSAAGTGS